MINIKQLWRVEEFGGKLESIEDPKQLEELESLLKSLLLKIWDRRCTLKAIHENQLDNNKNE